MTAKEHWEKYFNASYLEASCNQMTIKCIDEYAQSQVNEAVDKAIVAVEKLSYRPWRNASSALIDTHNLIEELKKLKR